MEWISEWLKQIILLLLIATFVDLLLPQQALSRYVKLVLGLLIILAILSPILRLLSDDLDVESLVKGRPYPTQRNLPTMAIIEERAQSLKEHERQSVLETWKQQMMVQLEQELQRRFHVTTSNAVLQAHWKGEQLEVSSVKLTIGNPTQIKQSQVAVKPIQITPIRERQPVKPPTDQRLVLQIKEHLYHWWKIERNKIDVRFE